jgi:predicted nucleic-acid-binding protein
VRGLDTNVLVRYLTRDDAVQFRQADAFIAATVAAGDRGFLNPIVLCELVWVLRGSYRFEKATVLKALDGIVATAQFVVDAKDVVRRAIEDYRGGNGDFADYLLGRWNQDAGCETTATFDRRLEGREAFRLL